jgi:hypothetical protein
MAAHVEMATGVMKNHPKIKYPSKVIIEIFISHPEKKIFETSLSLAQLGFNSFESPNKELVCIRFKSLMNIIKLTGDSHEDFSPSSF